MSDRTCSPKEIIKLASEKRIKAIALTYHDSVEGVIFISHVEYMKIL
jgi:predicted metal-dependent phosphoesterase TrpH